MGSDVNVPEEAVEALVMRRLEADWHIADAKKAWSEPEPRKPLVLHYIREAQADIQAAAPAIRSQERERVDAALRSIPGFLPDAAFFQKFYARLAALGTKPDHV